jgi:hypothetical protein
MIVRTRRAEDVMHRLPVVTLVMGLLAAGPGPVALAQTSSPSPAPSEVPTGVTGRFVLPEGGYGVTFPEGWEVQVFPAQDGPTTLVARRSDGSATCDVTRVGPCDGPPSGGCMTLLHGWAADRAAWFESGSRMEMPSALASTTLTVPGGSAVRVDAEWDDWPEYQSAYLLTDGQVAFTLICGGRDRPDDRWLSVAESFEFLPAER